MNEHTFVQDLAVVMIVAGIVTLIFRRFHQPVLLGYILAGFIIGPHTPPYNLIQSEETIKILSELGVILLMFSLGLCFNLKKVRRVGVTALIATILEILFMLWIGFMIGQAFGWGEFDSIFLGAILSISSTTIIIKALHELELTREKFSELIFGILVVEDILAIAMLALLSSIATSGSVTSLQVWDVTWIVTKLTLFLIVVLVVGLLATPSLLRMVSKTRSREALLISALGLCFGVSLLAMYLDYSVALGAFLIGAIIAESREHEEIHRLIEPVRDMFSAIFFVSVGLLIDPSLLVKHALPTAVITLAMIAGKVFACTLGVLLTGNNLKTSARVGMGLAQIGEFSFIIALLGQRLQVTSDFLYPIAVTVSALTTLTTPYLIRHSDSFANWLESVMPKSLLSIMAQYDQWIRRIGASSTSNPFRQLIKRQVWFIVLNLALITSIFLVANYIAENAPDWWPKSIPTWLGDLNTPSWFVAALLSLPLGIAFVRKLQAVGMMYAEVTFSSSGRKWETVQSVRNAITSTILVGGCAFLGLWILIITLALFPTSPVMMVLLLVLGIVVRLFHRFMIRIYSKGQYALEQVLTAEEEAGMHTEHTTHHPDENNAKRLAVS